jgi:ubiquitin-like 1-activating enzyme E1 B
LCIFKGVTECYDCTTKPIPRTYPTCTIRSTPTTPVHCISWAKGWLFVQLFGEEDETEDAELDKALQDGENGELCVSIYTMIIHLTQYSFPADQIAALRKESGEMGTIRAAIAGIAEDASHEEKRLVCQRTFDKLFNDDVERLLRMEDMWRKRIKPVPIQYNAALSEQSSSSSNGNSNGSSSRTLVDQKLLSIRETVQLFDESLLALAHRIRTSPGEPISFDKDDLDTLNFVTATSNIRSRIYHIEPQTRFEVKRIAGNIIPAIASTNAIIAGAQVFQLLQALVHAWKEARFVSLNKMNPSRLVTSFACGKPSVECAVCQDDYARASVDINKVTLGQFKEAVLRDRESGGLGYQVEGLEIFEAKRLLADEDFDDNLEQTLEEMKIGDGMIITCVDEDGIRANVHILVTASSFSSSTDIDFGPVDKLPVLRDRAKVTKPTPETDDDDDVVEMEEMPQPSTTSKRKRTLEEDAKGEADRAAAADASNKRKKLASHTGKDEDQAIELD